MRDEDTSKTEQGSGDPSKKDRPLTPVERTIGMMLCAALALFLLYLGLATTAGCAAIDAEDAYTIYTNISVRVKGSGASGENVGAPSSGDAPEPSSSFVADWRYGGFKGGSAKEDSRCRIGKLKIGGDSLSFKWESGIPSDWKRGETKKGPMIVACAFYFEEKSGKWVGGKFDWIDENRSSRSLENIKGGYNGWNTGAWNAAKRRAFCVASADGKWRSNLVED